jgi:hypothetical protein
MFHPIPPVLSGTDGKLNLYERASRLPARERGISNAGNNDRRVCTLARPTLDCLWMEAPEDGGSSYAIEKRFNSLRLSSGYGGRRIESIEMHRLSSGIEPLGDAQVNVCV